MDFYEKLVVLETMYYDRPDHHTHALNLFGYYMPSLSDLKRPSRVEMLNKIDDVMHGKATPEDIQRFLQSAPLIEAAQLYVEGFNFIHYINYNRWADRLEDRLIDATKNEREQLFEELMGVFEALQRHQYDCTDYGFFYATWGIPGFASYAQQEFKQSAAGSAYAKDSVRLLVRIFCQYLDQTNINANADFNSQWKEIVDIASNFGVDLKSIVQEVSEKSYRFSPKAAVSICEYFNWDSSVIQGDAITMVFSNGKHDEIQKLISNLPLEAITHSNGSLLYRVLRGGSLLNDVPPDSKQYFGVPALLKHIDYIQCLKSRFHDVRPTERFEVAANLAPFLTPDDQERLFDLLEDSLARTKNKKEIKELKECTANKAEGFKRLWGESNLRKKMKEETSHIQTNTKRKM